MVAKKRKSKRQTLQEKFRIVKRVKDHKKKLKKGVFSDKIKKKKVENTIPSSWPYKAELLKEIEDAKERMEENKQRQKEKRQDELVIILYFFIPFNIILTIFFSLEKTSYGNFYSSSYWINGS